MAVHVNSLKPQPKTRNPTKPEPCWFGSYKTNEQKILPPQDGSRREELFKKLLLRQEEKKLTGSVNESVRAIVEDALLSRDTPQLADMEIARLLGVSNQSVSKYRKRLEATGEISRVDRRLGRRCRIDVRRLGRWRADLEKRRLVQC